MVVLVIATLPDQRPEKIDTVGFDTTESAELYFKNVRSFYYTKKEEGEGIFDVYRLNSLFSDSTATLPFAIYHNWRSNEGFIRLDTSRMAQGKYSAIQIDSSRIMIKQLDLPSMNNESQYLFAKEVYKALRDEKRISVVTENDSIEVGESTSISIERTLTDYFRLVGKI